MTLHELLERFLHGEPATIDAVILGESLAHRLSLLLGIDALVLRDASVDASPGMVRVTGIITMHSGSGEHELRCTATFDAASESGDVGFEIIVTDSSGGGLACLLPLVGSALAIGDLTLIAASSTRTITVTDHTLAVEPGLTLVSTVEPAERLTEMVGDVGPLLHGPIDLSEDGAPLLTLTTAPAFTIDLGAVTLTEGTFVVATAETSGEKVDDEDPDDEERDDQELDEAIGDEELDNDEEEVEDEEGWEDGENADDEIDDKMLDDLESLFSTFIGMQGSIEIPGARVPLRADLSMPSGMIAFTYAPPASGAITQNLPRHLAELEPITLPDLAVLNELLGNSDDWLVAFPHRELLAAHGPARLEELTLLYDPALRIVIDITVRVASSHPVRLNGIRDAVLDPLTIGWNVAFPHGVGERSVYVAGGGTLDIDGLRFDATVDPGTLAINASAERGSVDFFTLLSRPFMGRLVNRGRARHGARFTDIFMDIACTREGEEVTCEVLGIVATNSRGDEETWERRVDEE